MQSGRSFAVLDRISKRWASYVHKSPWVIVFISLAISIAGGYLATGISIKSDFASLLPDTAQSVIDLREISDRMGGMGTLMVQVQGEDLKSMERFADDLVKRIRAYPEDEVRFVDYKIDTQKDFFDRYMFLYLSQQELTDLEEGLDDRIQEEKLKANPFYIDLDDEDDEEEEEFDFGKKREKYEEKLHSFDRYIDGYLTDKEGKTLIIVIKTPGTSTGVTFAGKMVEKVQKEVDGLNPKGYHDSMDVFLTGNLKTLIEEYHALRDDILIVSNVCVMLVLFAVALYYRSIRMTLILCLGLLAGIATTFGLTYLHIGYLTAATAFLASIVAGNGINFGIYFLARYMEERKSNDPVPDILARSIRGTISSVSTAAFAAGASYLSLMGTEFRGFNHFGFIGGVGMIICLLFALTLDPALVVIIERHFPFSNLKKRSERSRIFSNAVAWIVEKHAKFVFGLGIVLLIGAVISISIMMRDPFEYSFKRLRNQYSRNEGSGARSSQAEKILGERSSPHVILADNVGQVSKLREALEPYLTDDSGRADIPKNRIIKSIKTINDYLPGTESEQQTKLTTIVAIRKLIVENDFTFLNKDDQQLLKDLTPPADLDSVNMEKLPPEIMRQYIEDNGTRGTPMYVYMADGMSVWNGRDLEKFASVVREIKLDDGATIRSSGNAVIFTDMINYVVDEGPWATLGAFLFVTLVIIISFRRFGHILLLTSSMAAGVILMMGVAAVFGQKINFLNYIAIPIQFGIGVDYSVNIYSRFLEEGKGSLGRVLRSTGGAVMITSTTTIIGYGALWFSINGAINTFGTLANIGEFACLSVAVLFMPSVLAIFLGGLKAEDKSDEGELVDKQETVEALEGN